MVENIHHLAMDYLPVVVVLGAFGAISLIALVWGWVERFWRRHGRRNYY